MDARDQGCGRQGLRGQIAGGEHFQARIEIVDVMQRHCLRCFRTDRRTKLRFAMMRADQMQQMQPDIFRGGEEVFPRLRVFGR